MTAIILMVLGELVSDYQHDRCRTALDPSHHKIQAWSAQVLARFIDAAEGDRHALGAMVALPWPQDESLETALLRLLARNVSAPLALPLLRQAPTQWSCNTYSPTTALELIRITAGVITAQGYSPELGRRLFALLNEVGQHGFYFFPDDPKDQLTQDLLRAIEGALDHAIRFGEDDATALELRQAQWSLAQLAEHPRFSGTCTASKILELFGE
jgi:hypothetical protein